jgi:hypothetical protein
MLDSSIRVRRSRKRGILAIIGLRKVLWFNRNGHWPVELTTRVLVVNRTYTYQQQGWREKRV